MKVKPRIGVIGGSLCTDPIYEIAREVGREIARRDAYLITGGGGGVMEAACKGAKEEHGTTIGILPGDRAHGANPWVDIPVVTGMSHGRNIIVIRSCDAVIAVDGAYGTLSEVAFALKLNIPLISLNSWDIDTGIIKAATPAEALTCAFSAIHY